MAPKKAFNWISKPTIISILISVCCLNSYAQQSINSAGNSIINSSGSFSHSIGIPVSLSNTNASGSLTEGIQNVIQIIDMPTANKAISEIDIKAYPNPTSALLKIDIQEPEGTQYLLRLLDVNGREQFMEYFETTLIKASLAHLSNGLYVAQLFKGEQLLKSFKIIKN